MKKILLVFVLCCVANICHAKTIEQVNRELAAYNEQIHENLRKAGIDPTSNKPIAQQLEEKRLREDSVKSLQKVANDIERDIKKRQERELWLEENKYGLIVLSIVVFVFILLIVIGIQNNLKQKPRIDKPVPQKIKLPQKAQHGAMWRLLLGGGKKIPDFDTTVCFNRIHGKPTFFEYDGDLNKIKNLANNPGLLNWLCDIRQQWFESLKKTKNIPMSTMTFFLFDAKGNILGIAAMWEEKNFGRDFTPLRIPIEVIKDTSYDYQKLKQMSEKNRKAFLDIIGVKE